MINITNKRHRPDLYTGWFITERQFHKEIGTKAGLSEKSGQRATVTLGQLKKWKQSDHYAWCVANGVSITTWIIDTYRRINRSKAKISAFSIELSMPDDLAALHSLHFGWFPVAKQVPKIAKRCAL